MSGIDWQHMTADQWTQTVSGLLLAVMCYLLKRFVDNDRLNREELKQLNADTKLEHEKDRTLTREIVNQQRMDHNTDMANLFEDAREDRKVTQSTLKDLTLAVRSLQGQIDKRVGPTST